MFNKQWYLKDDGQSGAEITPFDINVESVWQKGYLGQRMFIAVLDILADRLELYCYLIMPR